MPAPDRTPAAPAALAVFVSYAREDAGARARLQGTFEASGIRVLGDWMLEHGPNFWDQLVALIQEADVVVALISPAFVPSVVGRREIETAAGFGKRILPIVVRDVPDPDALAEPLRTPQWAFLRSDAEFDAHSSLVVRTLHTDFEDLRLHRDLLLAAERWVAAHRDGSLVLRGRPLEQATIGLERMGARGERWFPKPTSVQIEFLAAGAAGARRRRTTIAALAATALLLAVGAGYALFTGTRELTAEQRERQRQQDIQTSRRLIAAAREAGFANEGQAQLHLLLAAEAVKLMPLPEGVRELRESLHALGRRRGSMPFPEGRRFSSWSDDGRHMAAVGADGAVYVYDTALRREKSVHRVSLQARSTVFSRDGTVLTVVGDTASEIIDLPSGRILGRLPAGGRASLSADGAYAAFETETGAILFDTRTGSIALDRRKAGRNGRVAVSPDGKRFLSLGFGLYIIDVESGREVRLPLSAFANEWVLNPENQTLVAADSDGTVRLIDATTGAELANRREDPVPSLRFDRAGRQLAVVGTESVRVVNASDLRERFSFAYRLMRLAAFNGDGTLLAVAGDRRTLVIDLQRGTVTSIIDHGQDVVEMVFTDEDDLLSVEASETGQQLSQYALASRLVPYRDDSDLYGVGYSRPLNLAAIAHGDGRVGVYSLSTGRRSFELAVAGRLTHVSFNTDGTKIVTAGDEKTVRVFDVATQQQIKAIEVPAAPRWVVVNGDETLLAVASDDRRARVYSLADGRLVRDITTMDVVNFVAFSPAGTLLATAVEDGTVRVDAIATGLPVWSAKHESGVNAVAFSPDGRVLASASNDGTTRLHDAASGASLITTRHPDWPLLPTFSPDGALMATLDDDDVVRVYDTRTGTLQDVIQPPEESVPFFSDNRRLMTAWISGRYLEWREHVLDPQALLAEACARLTRSLSQDEWAEHFPGQPRRATCEAIK